uniref:Putative secreted protein n=1 Tax=Ixodes ricinus TaxID=34613 RepID=A0A6B0UBD3_IXORI
MLDPFFLPVVRLLGLVRLDAAYVVGCTLHQGLHQLVGLALNFRARGGWSALHGSRDVFWEEAYDEGIGAALHHENHVCEEDVPVLLAHAVRVVAHLARVVVHNKS